MRINSTWVLHHEEQVEACRAEFMALWHVEANLMRVSGKSKREIKLAMLQNWIAFLETRVSEKYPGDVP